MIHNACLHVRCVAFFRFVLAFAMAVALPLLGAHPVPLTAATLATITVNSTADADGSCPGTCTLRTAISTASSGSTIVFDPTLDGATITLASSSPFAVGISVTIQGPAHGITISGDGTYQIFSVSAAGTLTLQGLTLTKGSASQGGAILNNGKLIVASVTFSNNNAASDGGAIYNDSNLNSLWVTGSTFISNTAQVMGGAIRVAAGSATIVNSSFGGNRATSGGGVAVRTTLTLSRSVFYNNVAWNGSMAGAGGGAWFDNQGATFNVTNVTFSGNQAKGVDDAGGGAILIYEGTLVLTHVTVATNSTTSTSINSGQGGGGIAIVISINTPSVKLVSSLVAGNTSFANKPDLSGNYQTGGYNIVGSTNGNTGIVDGVNNDKFGVSQALIGPLGNYGGNMQSVPLLPGSPALDYIPIGTNGCGSTIATDQRGISRAQNGACDVGAFESRGFGLIKVEGDHQTGIVNTAFASPLGVTVTSDYGEPVAGGRVSFESPSAGASASLSTSLGVTSAVATITGLGDASVSVTANAITGVYPVTASVAPTYTVFILRNLEHPTAAALASFDATPLRGRDVQLNWMVGYVAGCTRFDVYRSDTPDQVQALLAQSIPAHLESVTYSVVDHTPSASEWWYWLTCIPPDGATVETVAADSPVQTVDFTTYLPFMLQD